MLFQLECMLSFLKNHVIIFVDTFLFLFHCQCLQTDSKCRLSVSKQYWLPDLSLSLSAVSVFIYRPMVDHIIAFIHSERYNDNVFHSNSLYFYVFFIDGKKDIGIEYTITSWHHVYTIIWFWFQAVKCSPSTRNPETWSFRNLWSTGKWRACTVWRSSPRTGATCRPKLSWRYA